MINLHLTVHYLFTLMLSKITLKLHILGIKDQTTYTEFLIHKLEYKGFCVNIHDHIIAQAKFQFSLSHLKYEIFEMVRRVMAYHKGVYFFI